MALWIQASQNNSPMDVENLSFKIVLSGTYWDKKPEYSISIDNQMLSTGVVVEPTDSPQTISFSVDASPGEHELQIRLHNKADGDTVVDPIQQTTILKDMLLNIVDIEIDEISIGSLLWTGEYVLDDVHEYQGQQVTKISHCVNLGWNGMYVLKFSSPFYLWLLENL